MNEEELEDMHRRINGLPPVKRRWSIKSFLLDKMYYFVDAVSDVVSVIQGDWHTPSSVRVIDGNTIEMTVINRKEIMAFAFVDAPESSQAYGDVATERLRELVAMSESVSYLKLDDSGRGTIRLNNYRRRDGTIILTFDALIALAAEGLLWPLKKDSPNKGRFAYAAPESLYQNKMGKGGPKHPYAIELNSVIKTAMENRVGLFADKKPMHPSDYRDMRNY